jgi:membrane protease YdiL (CAAX protease family)
VQKNFAVPRVWQKMFYDLLFVLLCMVTGNLLFAVYWWLLYRDQKRFEIVILNSVDNLVAAAIAEEFFFRAPLLLSLDSPLVYHTLALAWSSVGFGLLYYWCNATNYSSTEMRHAVWGQALATALYGYGLGRLVTRHGCVGFGAACAIHAANNCLVVCANEQRQVSIYYKDPTTKTNHTHYYSRIVDPFCLAVMRNLFAYHNKI